MRSSRVGVNREGRGREREYGYTHVVASDPHLGHALGAGHLQPDPVATLREMDIRCDLASTQIDHVGRRLAVRLLPALVQPQLKVPARDPVALERLQGETLRLQETEVIAQLGDLGDVTGPVTDVTALQGHLEIRQGRVNVVLDRGGRAVAVVTWLRHARLKIHLHL